MASTLKLLGHFYTHKKCSISSLDPAEFRIFEYNPAGMLPPSTTRCTIASTWNVAGGVFTLQGQHFLEDLEFGWVWVETPAQPISYNTTHSNWISLLLSLAVRRAQRTTSHRTRWSERFSQRINVKNCWVCLNYGDKPRTIAIFIRIMMINHD